MHRRLITVSLLIGLGGCGSPHPRAQPEEIIIPARGTWVATLDSLEAHGVIRHRTWFDVVARARGIPNRLKRGTYLLRPNEHFRVIFHALTVGRGPETRLVIREGFMLREIADEVGRTLGQPPDSVMAAATDSSLIAQLGLDVPSLQGYLYPETYFVPRTMTARAVVKMMATEFLNRWDSEWDARLDSLNFSRYALVTLASIIEGETQDSLERPFVSGVYHNRLRRGMPLQADPTVIYALGVRRRLFERDYRLEHPYNTYRIRGLPPGPIGSPSTGSLRAALYPANIPYLFFVAGPDGKHIFSETNAAHERARARVRTLRREQR